LGVTDKQEPVEFDHVVLVCNGCRSERTIYPDRPIRGAQELIEWMKTKPTKCSCGALTCDVKAHVKNPASLTRVPDEVGGIE
jgi:hypothetical protein